MLDIKVVVIIYFIYIELSGVNIIFAFLSVSFIDAFSDEFAELEDQGLNVAKYLAFLIFIEFLQNVLLSDGISPEKVSDCA